MGDGDDVRLTDRSGREMRWTPNPDDLDRVVQERVQQILDKRLLSDVKKAVNGMLTDLHQQGADQLALTRELAEFKAGEPERLAAALAHLGLGLRPGDAAILTEVVDERRDRKRRVSWWGRIPNKVKPWLTVSSIALGLVWMSLQTYLLLVGTVTHPHP